MSLRGLGAPSLFVVALVLQTPPQAHADEDGTSSERPLPEEPPPDEPLPDEPLPEQRTNSPVPADAGVDSGIADAEPDTPASPEDVGVAPAETVASPGDVAVASPVETPADATVEALAAEPPPAPYRPYSIPWLLRPLPSVDVFRIDQSIGIHDTYGPMASGVTATVAQVLTMGVRIVDGVSLVMRQGWALTGSSDINFSAFLVGTNLSTLLDPTVRLSVFLATTIPQGGLNGDPSNRDARFARLAYENALWLPNYLAGIAGMGVAWIDGGWTVQAEATLFVLGRLYGPVDDALVNATFGFQVGYFVTREFSLSGELHHQHFLSSPGVLRRAPPADYGAEHQSQTSATLGARLHFLLAPGVWARPGLAWGIGFDEPLAGDAWQTIQLDIPFLY